MAFPPSNRPLPPHVFLALALKKACYTVCIYQNREMARVIILLFSQTDVQQAVAILVAADLL